MEIQSRNVCAALALGLEHLLQVGKDEESRAGPVRVAPGPVMTIYRRPWERVLFSPVRDAHPFFHLAESMWMLAGRNDVEFLNKFVHDFGIRFSEDGILKGSYGHRWRTHFGYDQLKMIIDRLKQDPQDRRVVLSMWDPHQDLMNMFAQSHLQLDGRKDIPCNTHVYFRIRDGQLDMTVCCRSNDIIWGAYGANAVHFSFLQEYMAARLGIGIGLYYQVSNNYHAYVSEIKKLEEKAAERLLYFALFDDRYVGREGLTTTRLVDDPDTFDGELKLVLAGTRRKMNNRFLSDTVAHALDAHKAYKSMYSPDQHLSEIAADDWRTACTEWINRRTQSQAIRDAAVKSPDTTPGHISENRL